MISDPILPIVIAQDNSIAPGIAGRGADAAPATADAAGAVQDPNATGLPTGQQQPAGGGGFAIIMFGMLAFLVFMMIMSSRTQKKQQRIRDEMLGALRKHDKVLTRGGMIGTIVEMRNDELILRLDEATGTRATFSRSAIDSVVKPAHSKHEDQPEPEDTFDHEPAEETAAAR